MRLATFNVENMFDRAKAMSFEAQAVHKNLTKLQKPSWKVLTAGYRGEEARGMPKHDEPYIKIINSKKPCTPSLPSIDQFLKEFTYTSPIRHNKK